MMDFMEGKDKIFHMHDESWWNNQSWKKFPPVAPRYLFLSGAPRYLFQSKECVLENVSQCLLSCCQQIDPVCVYIQNLKHLGAEHHNLFYAWQFWYSSTAQTFGKFAAN